MSLSKKSSLFKQVYLLLSLVGLKIFQIAKGCHRGDTSGGEDTVYYRPAGAERDLAPAAYLQVDPEGILRLDLEKVPYRALEQIAKIAKFQLAETGGTDLIMAPDLLRMGQALEVVRDQPLVQWLREKAPNFRQALETVEARWGKQIVHQNLVIAQVRDLGLKVQLERTFSDPQKVIFLPDDYLAFPPNLLPQIERLITKSGHVIKRVQHND